MSDQYTQSTLVISVKCVTFAHKFHQGCIRDCYERKWNTAVCDMSQLRFTSKPSVSCRVSDTYMPISLQTIKEVQNGHVIILEVNMLR